MTTLAGPAPLIFGLYGEPPAELADRPEGAVQFSPLVPGSAVLEDQPAGSLGSMVMLGSPGTVERRHALALADYAVGSKSQAAKEVAFGLTDVGRSMGQWVGCGGRAVTPLQAATMPVFTRCSGGATQPKQYTFDVSQHCRYSDSGTTGMPACR